MNTCFDYGCAGCENCVDYESQTMTNTSTTLTDDEIEALSRKYVSVRGKEDNHEFAWLDFARAVIAADRRLTADKTPDKEYALDQWWFAELESIHGVCELTMDQYRAINIARKALRLSLLPTAPPETTGPFFSWSGGHFTTG
jgi:hypothetical protein